MTNNILHELVEIKRMVDETRLKHEFWRGVVRGVIGTSAAFAGLVTLVYYLIQIVIALR